MEHGDEREALAAVQRELDGTDWYADLPAREIPCPEALLAPAWVWRTAPSGHLCSGPVCDVCGLPWPRVSR